MCLLFVYTGASAAPHTAETPRANAGSDKTSMNAICHLKSCEICPRRCRVNRLRDQRGVCGVGRHAVVASYGPHFGEERVLVGAGGSGTIFFSGCNLLCSFCQNCDISHGRAGRETGAETLAWIMERLTREGCENINLVTPTHVVPQILEALERLKRPEIPLVYNSNGYESVETLRMLDGIIDIYLPDFKFWKGEGRDFMPGVSDYGEVTAAAVAEMHRQVGDLEIRNGVAVRGVLVRHLVMPNNASNHAEIFRFLAGLSPDMYVNVMEQYTPHFRARGDHVIGRRVTRGEFEEALAAARAAGLHRIEA